MKDTDFEEVLKKQNVKDERKNLIKMQEEKYIEYLESHEIYIIWKKQRQKKQTENKLIGKRKKNQMY